MIASWDILDTKYGVFYEFATATRSATQRLASFNTFRPRQTGRQFAEKNLQMQFL